MRKGEGRSGGCTNRYQESAANEVHTDDEGGDVPVQAKVPLQRKKAAAVDQACCRRVGSGIICLRRMENNSSDSDADQKRRRKHDKGNIAKRKQVILANMVTSDPRHHRQLIWI